MRPVMWALKMPSYFPTCSIHGIFQSTVFSSIADPDHFDADPDPDPTSEKNRIRIRPVHMKYAQK
jgi:hypothetical protein